MIRIEAGIKLGLNLLRVMEWLLDITSFSNNNENLVLMQPHSHTNSSVFACRSNCDSSAANVLRKYYQKPYFLPDDSESSKTDWIFMGCPGYGAHLHVSSPLCFWKENFQIRAFSPLVRNYCVTI